MLFFNIKFKFSIEQKRISQKKFKKIMGLSQKLKNTVKTIFMNYLEFHNAKLEMNLEKVNNLIFQVYFDFFFMNDCFV